MKNNTFYFSHDFNAHNDVKILFLRQQLGMEGYGIYWFLIEKLADAGGYLPLKIIPVLSMQMHTNEVKVSAVINEFELFNVVDDKFFSIRLIENLDKVENIRKTNSEKGKRSGEKRRLNSKLQLNSGSTTDELQLNQGATAVEQKKGKEIKEKESKQKENKIDISKSNLFRQPVVPSKDDVWEFFKSSGGTKEMAKSFYDKYEATGWMLNGSPVVNFRALAGRFIANWQQNDAKRNPPVQEQKQTLTKLPTYIQPKYD
jgi:uncharacterized protein YdaU (DUF1376 family)